MILMVFESLIIPLIILLALTPLQLLSRSGKQKADSQKINYVK
jgi:hypothetical protein